MTMLKRYVLSQFVKIYLLTASGLIGIFLIVDFFERIDEFLVKDAPMIDLISYYIFQNSLHCILHGASRCSACDCHYVGLAFPK